MYNGFRTFLRQLRQALAGNRTRGARPHRARCRPIVESFEERIVPAFDLTLSNSATLNVASGTLAGATIFMASGSGANLNWADVLGALQVNDNVLISSGVTGTEAGNITDTTGAQLTALPGNNLHLTIQSGSGAGLVGNIAVEQIVLGGTGSSLALSAQGSVTTGILSGVSISGSPQPLASASITATQGSIGAQAAPLPGPIDATNLALQAGAGIGTAAAPLPTQVSNLVAQDSTSGGIFVSNTGALNIGVAGAPVQGVRVEHGSGAIALSATGTVTIATSGQSVSSDSGTITIQATGAGAAIVTGGNQTAVGVRAVSSATTTLAADGDLVLGTAGQRGNVVGGGPVALTAGGNITLDDRTLVQAVGPGNGVTASAGGNISLQATSASGAEITTDDCPITLSTGVSDIFTNNAGATGGLNSHGGTITLSADAMVLDSPIDAGTGSVTLQQVYPGRRIDLGTDATGKLGLTQSELDQVRGNVLQIGNSATGGITVSAPINRSNRTLLLQADGGSITSTPAGALTATNLALQAGNGNGTAAAPLPTQVSNLVAADSTSGGIFVSNTGALTIGFAGAPVAGVDDLGDIALSATGTVTITTSGQNVTTANGNVTINATGATADIVTGGGGNQYAVYSGGLPSTVTLNAGRDLVLGTAGQRGGIFGRDAVSLAAGRNITVDESSLVEGYDGGVTASAGGNISLQATHSTGAAISVWNGGPLTLTTGANGVFTNKPGASGGLFSHGGDIGISADAMVLDNPVAAVAASVTLQQVSPSRPIDLGSDTAGALGLTQAELNEVTGSLLQIGNSAPVPFTGGITVSAAIDAGTGHYNGTLVLQADAGTITSAPGGALTATNLALQAGAGIGTAAAPLPTQVSNLVAQDSTSGGIFVSNTGALTIGFAGAPVAGVQVLHGGSGDIVLSASGTVTITTSGQGVTNYSGNITINALGTAADIVTGGKQFAVIITAATNCAVTLHASRDLRLGTAGQNGSVEGGGPVSLTAGRNLILDEGTRVEAFGTGNGVTASAGGNISLQATHSTGAAIVNFNILGGPITLTTGANGIFTNATGTFGGLFSHGGAIRISADAMVLDNPVDAGAGSVTLQQVSPNRAIDLGTNTAGALGLTQAELNEVTGSELQIGNSATANPHFTGGITVSAPIDAGTGNYNGTLVLQADAGTITSSAAGALTATNLALLAGAGIGTSDSPLATTVGNLVAQNSTSGGIFVSNTGALNIGFAGAPVAGVQVQHGSGDIVLSATGTVSITTNGQIVATHFGNITINALGAMADIVTGGNQVAVVTDNDTNATATLHAGRDLVLGTAGQYGNVYGGGLVALTAGGNITVDEGTQVEAFGSSGNGVTASAGGNITLQATNAPGAAISTGALPVTLTTGANGIFRSDPGTLGVLSFGNITISADAMVLNSAVDAAASSVTLQQVSPSRPIDLGTNSAGALGLTQAELDHVSGSLLQIGNISTDPTSVPFTGGITVSAAIDAGTGNYNSTLFLQAGAGSITSTSAGAITATNLALLAGAGIGSSAAPLATTVSNLVAQNASTGGIFISNTGALNIGFAGAPVLGVQVEQGSGDIALSAGTVTITTGGLRSCGGAITISADAMVLDSPVDAGTGSVTLQQVSASRPIDLGTNTAGALGLTQAELDQVTGSLLRIGASADPTGAPFTGGITVSAPIDAGTGNYNSTLSLQAGAGAIAEGLAGALSATNLAVQARTVALQSAANHVTNLAGTTSALTQFGFNFTSGADLTVGTVDGVVGVHTANPLFGDITLSGGAGNRLTVVQPITTPTGRISLTFDAMTLNAAVSANAFGLYGPSLEGLVTLAPVTAGRAIDLGTDAAGSLGLTDSELAFLNAGTAVRIGTATNTGGITVSSAITRHPGYNTLDLIAGSATIGQTAPLSVARLAIQTAGIVTLGDAGNDVDSLAASVTGVAPDPFLYHDANGLAIATVDQVAGIRAIDTVTVTAAGNLTLAAPTTAGNTATLTAGGAILDGSAPASANDVTATNLALLAGAGIGSSADPLETTVSNLVAQNSTSGGIFISNTGALNIGFAGAPVLGVQVQQGGGDLVLSATGTVTITTGGQNVRNDTGNLTINATGAAADLVTGGDQVAVGVNGTTSATATLHADRDLLLGMVGQGGLPGQFGGVASGGLVALTAGRNLTLDENTKVESFSTGITASAGGNISLQATSAPGAALITGAGPIVLSTGISGVFTNNAGAAGGLYSHGGAITVSADDMVLNSPISAGSGSVTLQQVSTGRAINLGTDTNLGLAQAELSQVTAGLLRIGNNDAAFHGGIDVAANIATANTLSLQAGAGAITESGGALRATSLALQGSTISLTSAGNAIANVAGLASSAFTLVTSTSLNVTTVDGVRGIQASSLSLTTTEAGSALTVAAPITASRGDLLATGAIVAAGGLIDVPNLVLQADDGIGSDGALPVAGPVQLAFRNQAANNVQIRSTGALTITGVDQLDGSAGHTLGNFAPAGTTTLLAMGGALTFALDTTSGGTLAAATTIASNTPADAVTINSGITVESSAGDVTLTAGDSIAMQPASLVKSDTAAVALTAGAGATDKHATVTLQGTIRAASVSILSPTDLGIRGISATGTASITSTGGAILDGSNAAAPAITAGTLNLDAATGIGPLEIQAGTLAFSNRGAGDVSIVHVAGNLAASGTNSAAINLAVANGGALTVSAAGITSAASTITLTADAMTLAGAVNAHGAAVTLQPFTAGRPIDLGTNPSAGALGLAQADLDNVTAGTLHLGSDSSRSITITAPIAAPTGWSTLALVSGGTIRESGGSLTVTSLQVEATGGVALTSAGNAVTNLSASAPSFRFTDSTTLDISAAGIATNGGALSVHTTAGNLAIDAGINAGGGAIDLETAGMLTSNAAIATTAGSPVLLAGATMDLAGGSITAAGGGRVTLRSSTAGDAILLGAPLDAAAATLELSSAELNTIATTGVLQIGDTNAGAITITNAIAPAAPTLDLETSGAINETTAPAVGTITVGSLALRAGGAVTMTGANNVAALAGAGQAFTFTSAGPLTIGTVDGLAGVTTNGAIAIRTSAGNLTISNNVSAGAAPLDLAAGGSDSLLTSDAALSNSGGNPITLTADRMALAGTLTAGGGGRVVLRAATAGRPLDLADADPTGSLNLSDAELSNITTTGTLQLGAADGGSITIGAAINLPAVATLDLETGGGVAESGADAGITVGNLALRAGGAVTLSNASTVSVVSASAGPGFAFTSAGPLTIGTVDGLAGIVTTNGAIAVATVAGSLTVSNHVRAGAASIDLAVGGVDSLLTSNDAIASSGGNPITLTADRMALAAGTITASGRGRVTLAAATPGQLIDLGATADPDGALSLSNAELSTITTSGTLQIGAGSEGDVTLSTGIRLTRVPSLTINTADAILADNASGPDLTVTDLALRAANGIRLDTAVSNLALRNTTSGNVRIANTGAVTLTAVDTLDGTPGNEPGNLAAGATTFTATGPLTFASSFRSGGTLAATAAGDLTINPAASIISSGNLQLTAGAGDNALTLSGTVAALGTVTLTLGPGGNTATIDGTVTGSAVQVQGGSGDDTFTINPTDASSAMTLAGGDGADRFDITPNPTAAFTVHGGNPSPPASPGDTLNIDLAGTTSPQLQSATGFAGTWSFGNRQSITFDTIETLLPTADLAVTLSATPDVPEGGTITYTSAVTNNGPSDDSEVVLTEPLPAGTTFVSSTFTGYDPTTGQVNLGTLAAGATVHGSFVVRVPEEGTVPAAASVAGALPDLSPSNNSQSASSTVAELPVVVTGGFTVTATEGSASAVQTVATFTDPGGAKTLADYSATIDWGDGTPATVGTITQTGTTFTVTGAHRYAEEGTFPIQVTMTHDAGSSSAVSASATVADAALTATPGAVSTTAGATFSGVVASFTDANPDGVAGDFTAAINWGDSTTTPGTLGAGSDGSFQVAGEHVYASSGTFALTVAIRDIGSATATITSPVTVSDSTSTGTGDGAPPTEPSTPPSDGGGTPSDVGGGAPPTGPSTPPNDGGSGTPSDLGDGSPTGPSTPPSDPGNSGAPPPVGSSTPSDIGNGGAPPSMGSSTPTDVGTGGTPSDVGSGATPDVGSGAPSDMGNGDTPPAVVVPPTDVGTGGTTPNPGSTTPIDTGTGGTNPNPSISTPTDVGNGSTPPNPGSSTTPTVGSTTPTDMGTGGTPSDPGNSGATPSPSVSTPTDVGNGGTAPAVAGTPTDVGNAVTPAKPSSDTTPTMASSTPADVGNGGTTTTVDSGMTPSAGGSTAASATVAGNPILQLLVSSLNVQEAVPLHRVVVASFRPGSDALSPASFSVMIDWGDGSTSAGSVVRGPDGTFLIEGSHTYAEESAPAPFMLTVHIRCGAATASATGAAAVREAPLPAGTTPASPSGSHDQRFVQELLQDVLGTRASAARLNALVALLHSSRDSHQGRHLSRSGLIERLLTPHALQALHRRAVPAGRSTAKARLINAYCRLFLDRNVHPCELPRLLARFQGPGGEKAVIVAILSMTEYYDKTRL